MSAQKFAPSVRNGIHKVFHEKCFYCNSPITFPDLEVDHLLPEALLNDETKKSRVFDECALEYDFDITSYRNLVASCQDCNNKKGDNILHAGFIAIALSVIKKKLPKLEKLIEKALSDRQLGIIFRQMTTGLEKGVFTQEDLALLMERVLSSCDLETSSEASMCMEAAVNNADFDEPEIDIVWTEHAINRSEQRNISSDEVLEALRSGATFQVKEYYGKQQRYIVETKSGLHVAYEVKEERILIITCYYMDKKHLLKNRRGVGLEVEPPIRL